MTFLYLMYHAVAIVLAMGEIVNVLRELCQLRAVTIVLYCAEQKSAQPLPSIPSLVVLKGLQRQTKTNVLTSRK